MTAAAVFDRGGEIKLNQFWTLPPQNPKKVRYSSQPSLALKPLFSSGNFLDKILGFSLMIGPDVESPMFLSE